VKAGSRPMARVSAPVGSSGSVTTRSMPSSLSASTIV